MKEGRSVTIKVRINQIRGFLNVIAGTAKKTRSEERAYRSTQGTFLDPDTHRGRRLLRVEEDER